jgi:hypothetical protein
LELQYTGGALSQMTGNMAHINRGTARTFATIINPNSNYNRRSGCVECRCQSVTILTLATNTG